jgi:arsenate reductase
MRLPRDDDEVLLLHNARCSKSRATHALLEERGVAFTERRYLEDPLTREELEELARRLDLDPHAWARRGEAAWKEAGLDANASGAEVLEAMVRHPVLVERPIVVRGSRARVGRPPTNVLELFDEA